MPAAQSRVTRTRIAAPIPAGWRRSERIVERQVPPERRRPQRLRSARRWSWVEDSLIALARDHLLAERRRCGRRRSGGTWRSTIRSARRWSWVEDSLIALARVGVTGARAS